MNIKQFFPKELRGSFNLRKPHSEKPTPIYFVCRFGKMQYKISAGVKVYPKHWNPKTQEALVSASLNEIDNRNNSIVNRVLEQIRICFALEVNALLSEVRIINNINHKKLIEMMKTKISQSKCSSKSSVFESLMKSIKNDPISDETKRPYRNAINKFREFVEKEKVEISSFNDITLEVLKEYQRYLRNIKGQKGVKDGKLSANHINRLIKVLLQRLDNYAVREDLMDRSIFERAKSIKPIKTNVKVGEAKIALRDDEVVRLFNHKCSSQSDEDVKNMFCLNCCLGQRISDFCKLNDCIKRSDGHITIQLKQKKNGSVIDVPLLFQLAEDIITMYPKGLPKVTNNKMNSSIKRIAEEAGVGLESVAVPRQSGSDSAPTFENLLRCKLITTHTCRRTFITLLSLRGKTDRYIADYSGHSDMAMVEHYSKTTAAERLKFEETKREHPEMILSMIDYSNQKKAKVIQSLKGIGLAVGTFITCLFS